MFRSFCFASSLVSVLRAAKHLAGFSGPSLPSEINSPDDMIATSSGSASWEFKKTDGDSEEETFEASYSLTMILSDGQLEDGDEQTIWICMPLLGKNYCQFYRYEAKAATE